MSSNSQNRRDGRTGHDGEDSKRSEDEKPQMAVALSWGGGDAPPRVVASGRGAVAEKILDLAFANGVKVRQDADLVEILAAVDLDSFIPFEAFTAVAEILAYVYRVNNKSVSGGEK